jgi:hypothetical protein
MQRLAAYCLAWLWMGVFSAKGDFRVKFDTSTLSDRGLVIYQGKPATNVNLFAQLFYAPAGDYPIHWNPVGPGVRLAAGSGAPPGTWKGGEVQLSGIEDGQPALLAVFVWNRSLSRGWQDANSLDPSIGGLLSTKPDTGWSEAFAVKHEPGSSSSATLEGFPGIYLNPSCTLMSPPPAGDVTCDENGSTLLLPGVWQPINQFGDFAVWLLPQVVSNTLPGLQLGNLSQPPDHRGVTYTAIPNTYGEDRVYQYREGGFCDPPRWTATVLSIHVRPSPLRPYLATKLEGNRYSLVLRGLMARKYRLQRSSNLITWENRDEVVGNTSEVDLPGVENDSVHSRFYRVVDITGQ